MSVGKLFRLLNEIKIDQPVEAILVVNNKSISVEELFRLPKIDHTVGEELSKLFKMLKEIKTNHPEEGLIILLEINLSQVCWGSCSTC